MKFSFNQLFAAMALVLSLGLMACPHPDNHEPENVTRNDDFTKMGGHGYNANTQPAAKKPELAPSGHAEMSKDTTKKTEEHHEH